MYSFRQVIHITVVFSFKVRGWEGAGNKCMVLTIFSFRNSCTDVLFMTVSSNIFLIEKSRTYWNRILIFWWIALICIVHSSMIVAARPGLGRFPCQGPPPQPLLRAEEQEECLQVVVRGRMPQAAVR